MRKGALRRLFGGGTGTGPAQVGRYRLLAEIGSGGMGEVHRAFDPELDRAIAVKLLRPHVGSDAVASRARMVREAQAIAALSHPNVVEVYEVGAAEDVVYIAMELVPGQTLGAWLAAEERSVAAILAKFVAAAEGIAAAHRKGLVHRDVKPDNVLVTLDGHVKVVDFGLAREWDQEATTANPGERSGAGTSSGASASITSTGAAVGTPLYMAPEQHLGVCSPAADQFAFCVALYEAVYRHRPFRAKTLEALAAAKLSGPAAPPKGAGAPRFIARVLRRGLAADPSRRWPSMDDVVAALRAEGRPARRRALVAGVAVGGAVALAGLALYDRRPTVSPTDASEPTPEASPVDAELETELAQLRTAYREGREATLPDRVTELSEAAERASNSAVAADALLLLGAVRRARDEQDASAASFRKAIEVAEAAGLDERVAAGWLGLARHDLLERRDAQWAARKLASARASAARGDVSVKVRADIEDMAGEVASVRGEFTEALAAHLKAVEIRESAGEPKPENVAFSLGFVAIAQAALGRYDAAVTSLERVVELLTRVFGAEHQRVTSERHNLALALLQADRVAEGLTIAVDVLPRYEGDVRGGQSPACAAAAYPGQRAAALGPGRRSGGGVAAGQRSGGAGPRRGPSGGGAERSRPRLGSLQGRPSSTKRGRSWTRLSI